MTDQPPLSDAELDVIEARAAAASSAPWRDWIEARDNHCGDDFIAIGDFDDSQPDMYVQHSIAARLVPAPAADLVFIAHARQDIPHLIAEVRRLRAERPNNPP